MKFEKGHWIILFFNLAYIITFLIYYLSIKNYEFLWYIFVVIFFFFLIALTLGKTKFDYFILWGLSLWGFMHMMGGGFIFNGETLYKFVIPIFQSGDIEILKFDQIVHFFGFAVTTLIGYHLLKPHLNKMWNRGTIYFLLILVGMGAGALNEIVEFIAVVSFPETGVGGYYNTGLDLVFNAFGAIAGVLIIHYKEKFKHAKK
tara:strand:+ start:216 stop:821 length:606 start_codon:yes stop_codon:yes gene_type:complete